MALLTADYSVTDLDSLILKLGSWWVWPLSRRCLLLYCTWSYLCICWGSVLRHARSCICLLDYDYAYSSSKLIFKYISHLLTIDDIYRFQFACQMGTPFSRTIIYIKCNGFQAFVRKKRETVLFMMSQCYQIRNNLLNYLVRHTSNVFYLRNKVSF
jgi:hypothetical protein